MGPERNVTYELLKNQFGDNFEKNIQSVGKWKDCCLH
jgi:hypothetical protein